MILQFKVGDETVARVESLQSPARGDVFIIDGRDYVVEGIAQFLVPDPRTETATHRIMDICVVRCKT